MTRRRTFLRWLPRMARVLCLTAVAAVRMAGVVVTHPRGGRSAALAAVLARLLERLGGAFVKVGQIVGTRVDLIGVTVARELARLQDDVRPMAPGQAVLAVRRALPSQAAELAGAMARPPVASGSIASVYRVTIDDRPVALKVRRPEVARQLGADLAVLRALAAVAARTPGLRRVPLAEIVEQVGGCLVEQLDFEAERRKLAELAGHLAGMAGVVVPGPLPELCGDGVLAMEFVDGLTRASIDGVPDEVREQEVVHLVRAVYHLLFVAGFVHVDLHQGNTYFRPDGTVVLLDAGFTFHLGPTARLRFTQFFGGMIRGDGEACAEILLATVRGAAPGADTRGFRRDVADLVRRNAGAAVRDFNLPAFCVELFNLQRRYGLYAEPEFVFPMLSLLSLDGLVKEHHPLMDFQIEAAPYVMQSLLTTPDAGDGHAAEAP